jgi:hypothetical protein
VSALESSPFAKAATPGRSGAGAFGSGGASGGFGSGIAMGAAAATGSGSAFATTGSSSSFGFGSFNKDMEGEGLSDNAESSVRSGFSGLAQSGSFFAGGSSAPSGGLFGTAKQFGSPSFTSFRG